MLFEKKIFLYYETLPPGDLSDDARNKKRSPKRKQKSFAEVGLFPHPWAIESVKMPCLPLYSHYHWTIESISITLAYSCLTDDRLLFRPREHLQI
jgi:hypothetical protein